MIIDIKKEREGEHLHIALNNKRAQLTYGENNIITISEWRGILKKQNNSCAICGQFCHLCIDHIIPMAAGGLNRIDNIQGLCSKCNTRKGKTTDKRLTSRFLHTVRRKCHACGKKFKPNHVKQKRCFQCYNPSLDEPILIDFSLMHSLSKNNA